ncbi:MAG: hypothetical protein KAI81_07350 [Candidatus Marinimicrobia bacterium]|nr:hypothetical protein [Candidatus Neomarinimicrobiota bacterium]
MKNCYKFAVLISLFSIPIFLYSQSENYNNLAISWQKGLAGGGAAYPHSAASLWTNPSISPGKGFYSESHISFLPAGIQVNNLSFSFKKKKKLSTGFAFNSENFGNFDRRDIKGNLTGKFDGSQVQFLINTAFQFSNRLSIGYNFRQASLTIDDKKYGASAHQSALTLSDRSAKTRFSISSIKWNNETLPVYKISLSRELQYLPIIFCFDHDIKNKFDIKNSIISAYILPGEDLHFYAGLTLQHFSMQTQSMVQDFISGLGVGAAWHYKTIDLHMAFYHYGGLGLSSSMGISWALTS